jgi:hypothetical protein
VIIPVVGPAFLPPALAASFALIDIDVLLLVPRVLVVQPRAAAARSNARYLLLLLLLVPGALVCCGTCLFFARKRRRDEEERREGAYKESRPASPVLGYPAPGAPAPATVPAPGSAPVAII